MKRIKKAPILLTFFIIGVSISHAQEKSPLEVVKLFSECYGTPCMDEIEDHTTARFRDDKPKAVWIVDTWKALKQLEYERLNDSVIDSKALSNKAVVVVQSRIKTAAGESSQKEVYYLIRKKKKWLIDNLVVTDEEIDIDEIKL